MNSDLVFLIDSTSPNLRDEVLAMVKSVISGIYVDSTAASIAVVSYGSDATVQIGLGTITDTNQINLALDRIQFFRKFCPALILKYFFEVTFNSVEMF